MSDLVKAVGQRIRNYRTQLSLSQEKLAELADLNKNSVGAIERGESSPTIETLDRIAQAFEIPLHELTNLSQMNI